MAPRVSATETRPTHHVSLSDGTTTIGLTLCDGNGRPDNRGMRRFPIPATTIRQGSGVPTYDDRQPPYLAYVQGNWAGGIGNKEFNADATRFLSGQNIDTIRGNVILGPKRQEVTGVEIEEGTGDPDATYVTVEETGNFVRWIGSPITPSANISVKSITIKITVTDRQDFTLMILDDDAGAPDDTSYQGVTYFNIPNSGTYELTIPITATLTAATQYWLCIKSDDDIDFDIFTNDSSGNVVQEWESADPAGDGWTEIEAAEIIAFTLNGNTPGEVRFFEYKGALYAATKPNYAEAPKLYRNGLRGCAESNAADLSKTEIEAAVTLVSAAHIDQIIKIVGGTGATEEIPWRKIIDNDTDSVTVYPPWTITQDATTEFVILKSSTWYEITGHGLTKPISSVLVVDDIVYFAQGEANSIRRMKEEPDTGVWTRTWDDDGGANKAEHLEFSNTSNGRYIWRTLPSAAQVDKAAAVAWGTDLTFSGAIICGSNDKRITNIITYGEYSDIYVLKEDEFGSINSDDKYVTLPISEMKNASSWRNGKTAMVHGVYLYFSMLDGFVERYYDSRLDDVGPNRDEGLPDGYAGTIEHLIGFPGRFYAAINAGEYGYSSVLCYNGSGWHPIYVSGNLGKRINQLHIQSIPGDQEKFFMWIAEETNIFRLQIALNPEKDDTYKYAATGHLVSSWFYGGMKEVYKFWSSLKQFAENLEITNQVYTTLYYQTDVSSTWTKIADYDVSPVEDYDLSSDESVSGRRWRYKLTLTTTDDDKTPKVEAIVITLVERLASNQGYKLRFVISDNEIDLQSDRSQVLTASQVFTQLSTWANSDNQPTPLTLRSLIGMFDDKKVFIEPASTSPFSKAEEGVYMSEITVMEA